MDSVSSMGLREKRPRRRRFSGSSSGSPSSSITAATVRCTTSSMEMGWGGGGKGLSFFGSSGTGSSWGRRKSRTLDPPFSAGGSGAALDSS